MLFLSSLCLFSSLVSFTYAIPFPGPNPTVGYEAADINPLPTNTPADVLKLALRSLTTDAAVCGWIGGNGLFPATCSSGSTCVFDSLNKIVGCCPLGGPCTTGVYTGCVDANSPLQTVIAPNIVTCYGQAVCYQNSYPDGYHQYGCGVSSDATTVETTYSGQDPAFTLKIVRTDIILTGSSTSIASSIKPSRISTRPILLISTSSVPTSTILPKSTGIGAQAATVATESGIVISGQEDQAKVGLIVGCVIGGIGGIFALLAIGMCLVRSHRQKDIEPQIYQFPTAEKHFSNSSVESSRPSSHTTAASSTSDPISSPVNPFLYTEVFLNGLTALSEPAAEPETLPEWPLTHYGIASPHLAITVDDAADISPIMAEPVTPPIPRRSSKRKSFPSRSWVYHYPQRQSHECENNRRLTMLYPSNSVSTVTSSIYSRATDGQSYIENTDNPSQGRNLEIFPPLPRLEIHEQYGWQGVPVRMAQKVTDDQIVFQSTDSNLEHDHALLYSAPPLAERSPSSSFSWSSENTIVGCGDVRVEGKRVWTADAENAQVEDEDKRVAPLSFTLCSGNTVEKAGGRPVPLLGCPRIPSPGERERRLYKV